LGVQENERLKVLSLENGWCTVECLDRESRPGLVPQSYLKYAAIQGEDSFPFSVLTPLFQCALFLFLVCLVFLFVFVFFSLSFHVFPLFDLFKFVMLNGLPG